MGKAIHLDRGRDGVVQPSGWYPWSLLFVLQLHKVPARVLFPATVVVVPGAGVQQNCGDPPAKEGILRNNQTTDKFEEFSRQLSGQEDGKFVLCLYVSSVKTRSKRAIDNLKKLCDGELAGRCQLEVIDVSQRPELAQAADIIAIPTLVKKLPQPFRQLIGDLSDKERVLVALDLRKAD
jgi:circadian clock protein KaiB